MLSGALSGQIYRMVVIEQTPGFLGRQSHHVFLGTLASNQPSERAGNQRKSHADRPNTKRSAFLEWIHKRTIELIKRCKRHTL